MREITGGGWAMRKNTGRVSAGVRRRGSELPPPFPLPCLLLPWVRGGGACGRGGAPVFCVRRGERGGCGGAGGWVPLLKRGRRRRALRRDAAGEVQRRWLGPRGGLCHGGGGLRIVVRSAFGRRCCWLRGPGCVRAGTRSEAGRRLGMAPGRAFLRMSTEGG